MNQTPLYEHHRANAARLIDFHGWEMPLYFDSLVTEHHAVRSSVGLFDVSHMGKLVLSVSGSELQRLTASELSSAPGICKYTHFLLHDGTILDDVIITTLAADSYLCVCNAGSRQAVVELLRDQLPRDAVMDFTTDLVCLALQGPESRRALSSLLREGPPDLRPFRGTTVSLRVPLEGEGRASWDEVVENSGGEGDLFVTRTGYTGELGYEFFASAEVGRTVWNALVGVDGGLDVKPIGLGARDTLRLEKGYLLSGQDFDGRQTPLEAGYEWLIDWEHDFLGREPLLQLKQRGSFSRLFGLKMEDRAIPRRGNVVYREEDAVGKLTSASFSPTLARGIALGYLDPDLAKGGVPVEIQVRAIRHPAETVKPPFL